MTSANDFCREPVAAINGFRCRHHRAQTADVRRHVGNLTAPFSHMGKLHPTAEYQKLALPLLPAPRIGSIPKRLGLW
jgi:hypothetical protein